MSLETELEDRAFHCQKIAELFRLHPLEDISADTLKEITPHYQQRISQIRRRFKMRIENRPQYLDSGPGGRQKRLDGSYRYLPYEPLGRDREVDHLIAIVDRLRAEVSSPATPDFKQMLRDEIACHEGYAASTEPTAGLTTPREHRHTASVLRSMLLLIEFREGSSPARPQLETLRKIYEYPGVRPLIGSILHDQLAAIIKCRPARPNRFDCRSCGQGIGVDEDGCCRTCGADATVVLGEVSSPATPAICKLCGRADEYPHACSFDASPARPQLDWKRIVKLARLQADEHHM
jgi:hypothetical protein